MKEMVGGCCVCSDERGWPENPLVYCDGQNCTVAVHQACYGIVTVPTGPWYCRKCESQERAARVRCELCPSRDGALKKTDNQGWAHVVCALYIPEVRFGNVTTMEPIILQLIPPERYAKTCYICQEIGKGSRANAGACMQCNKSGCKQQFHVTCAQGLGLLCEEAGNYLDNVKYCGYCQHHYSKLKKGGNVKTIPPYKPVTHETGSSDATSSPEKELEPTATAPSSSTAGHLKMNSNQTANSSTLNSSSSSSSSSKQRKSSSTSKLTSSTSTSGANISGSNVASGGGGGSGGNSGAGTATTSSSNSSSSKNSSSSSSSSKDKDKHSSKSLNKISSSSKNQDKESSTSSSASSSTRDKTKSSKSNKDISNDHAGSSSSSTITSTNAASATSAGSNLTTSSSSKDSLGQKFTTLNFTESVVINSESVFGANEAPITIPITTNSSSTSSSTARESKNSSSSSSSSSMAKKRKADSVKLSSSSLGNVIIDAVDINNSQLALRDIIKDVSVTLIPLPMDKTNEILMDRDSSDKSSSTKKPKTEPSNPAPLPNTHEPNIQNVSPNLMGVQVAGSVSIKQQAILQTGNGSGIQQSSSSGTSSSSTSIQSHIKPPILKDVSDSRNRSGSPYNPSAAGINSSSSSSSTPSLFVSVPLSTANVPGVSLPSTTANDHSTRSSPHVNHHHSHHHSSNSLSSSQTSVVERQSPRILQSQSVSGSGSSVHLSEHNTSSSSTHSSNALHQPNMTPSLSHGTGPTAMDTGGLKITYEKQILRVAQLQEEQLPARRSRSQSGDSSSKSSSRSGKKRSAGNVSTSSVSSSSTSSTSTSGLSSTSAALPTGSNTGGTETTIVAGPAPTPPVLTGGGKSLQKQHNENNNLGESSNTFSNVNSSTNSVVLETTSSTAHSSNSQVNAKQLNKKMLRAQQSQQKQQQSQILQTVPPPPPVPQLPIIQQLQQQQQQQHSQQLPIQQSQQQQQQQSSSSTTTLPISNDENPSNSTPSSNSRTPDSGNFSSTTSSNNNNNIINISSINSSNSTKDINGGLKFTYESQIGATSQILPTGMTPPPVDPIVKDSPPSSPGSEAGSARKRGRKSIETKDMKLLFHNGVQATHMLGNQLNPSSSVAQKMSDQLHMEIEAHGAYIQPPMDPGPQLVGIPFPGKQQQSSTRSSSQSSGSNSLASMLGGANVNSVSGNTPQSLEQLLERQWEQGSQFLMEQAQHFDIASLLSCLHQLRTENVRLEEHVNNLVARRDHLLAVNARLAIPLNPTGQPNTTLNNMHMNGPTSDAVSSRISRTNVHYNAQQQLPVENGIDFRHSSHQSSTNNQATIRHSSANSNYSSSTSSTHNQHNVLSSSASSSSSRQQQSQHQQQQQPPQLPPTSSMPGMPVGGSSSASSSSNIQSSVDTHLIRASSGGRGGTQLLNSAANSSIAGLVGAGGGGGGGVNIASSSYHNATQQSAAYSTVHQSQLRRDDSQGKPS